MVEREEHPSRAEDEARYIGPILEKARTEKGLSLEEVEQATKIRKRYLQGLERDDYSVLPDEVYARGFLKTYANFLGLDGEEFARELRNRRRSYRRENNISYDALRENEFDRPLVVPGGIAGAERRVSGPTIVTLLVAVLVISAVIGGLYYVGRSSQMATEAPQQADRPQQQESGGGGQKQEPSPKQEGGNEGAAVPSSAGGEQASTGDLDTLKVTIRVEGAESWLSVQADGSTVYEQIAQPGFSETFEAERSVSISTGNAGAVEVEVNGQNIGVLGQSGEVLTRNFNRKAAS